MEAYAPVARSGQISEGVHVTQFTGAFPAPSWTPPAREPFVPLRPLTLGQILAGALRTLRHNPAVTLAPAIVVSLAAALGGEAFGRFVVDPMITAVGSSGTTGQFYSWFSTFGAGLLGWVVARALVISAGVVQQGVSACDVSHAVLGRRITPGGLRRRTRGARGPLIAWTAIVLVSIALTGGLATALLGLVVMIDPLAALGLGFLVFPGAAVLLAWLGTRLAVVPSVIVVEHLGLARAVPRAWRLTRGFFWRTFGIRILSWGMIWIAMGIVGIPVELLVGWAAQILAGNGDFGDYLAVEAAGVVAASVVGSIIGAIGLVVTTATDALVYLDLRMRHEGLDLELARFMEQRRGGTRYDPAEPDPYRTPGAAPAAPPAASAGQGSSWG